MKLGILSYLEQIVGSAGDGIKQCLSKIYLTGLIPLSEFLPITEDGPKVYFHLNASRASMIATFLKHVLQWLSVLK
jgi:hypothetical protein